MSHGTVAVIVFRFCDAFLRTHHKRPGSNKRFFVWFSCAEQELDITSVGFHGHCITVKAEESTSIRAYRGFILTRTGNTAFNGEDEGSLSRWSGKFCTLLQLSVAHPSRSTLHFRPRTKRFYPCMNQQEREHEEIYRHCSIPAHPCHSRGMQREA